MGAQIPRGEATPRSTVWQHQRIARGMCVECNAVQVQRYRRCLRCRIALNLRQAAKYHAQKGRCA